MNKRQSTYMYMEYLRILCAFMVIVIHVSGTNWFGIEIGSSAWNIQTFFNLGGRFTVCVFSMISGALLLSPDRTITIHDIFHKYIRRILICFVTWMLIYDAFYALMYQGGISYFLEHLFTMPIHLWYLLMLIGLYLATPVMKQVVKDRNLTKYMIILLVAFGTVFGTIKGITGFYETLAGDSLVYAAWSEFLSNLGEMNISFVPGYLGCFLLGHYIHEYGLGKWHKILVLAAIPCLLLSGLFTILVSQATGRYVYTFMLETSPLIIAASAGIMAFFKGEKQPEMKSGPETFIEKAAVHIGSHSMGIYLVHLAIMESLEHYFHVSVESFNPLFSVPLISLFIFVLSIPLAALMKKIPFVGKTMI